MACLMRCPDAERGSKNGLHMALDRSEAISVGGFLGHLMAGSVCRSLMSAVTKF